MVGRSFGAVKSSGSAEEESQCPHESYNAGPVPQVILRQDEQTQAAGRADSGNLLDRFPCEYCRRVGTGRIEEVFGPRQP